MSVARDEQGHSSELNMICSSSGCSPELDCLDKFGLVLSSLNLLLRK